MSSLRSRIALGVIGITSGVVLVAAIGVWLTSQAFLMRGVDSDLTNRIDRLQRMSGPSFPKRSARSPEQRHELRRLLRVVNHDGSIWPTPNIGDPDLAALAPPDLHEDEPCTVVVPSGQRLRVIKSRLERPEGIPTAWIQPFLGDIGVEPQPADQPTTYAIAWLAIDLDPAEAEMRRLAWMLGGLWLTATFMAVVAVFMLRSTLVKPLRQLDAAIDRLGPDDLAARLPKSAGPSEVRGTVDRLNQLLGRLEAAFRREQTTIANLAHELRTPVTALRTTIEFRRLSATDPGEKQVLNDAFRTISHMQRLVSDLLLLARLEAGKETLQHEAVEVSELVQDVLEVWSTRTARHQQQWELHLRSPTNITSSGDHLRLIIGNLISNAVQHAPLATILTVTLTEDALTISNALAKPLDTTLLGQSFYRGDEARSEGDHCGLGLALCRRLADILGMHLDLNANNLRFTAVLRLGG